ncbi:predicted protein [Plenodomus lingam JN3]|uniref:Predicted protein n=1 Tax=Leptosphaeria maculans (strain JN3 / isolate v23.1.3 / race Av1-4-5-6-7-8) TaxID=985895 RepID=E4ZZS6_LEPMJ|nr:predicted protein [Plenodomus lingam JN3]CBX96786.1 predicted protein [Plenodomus lingam JN3]
MGHIRQARAGNNESARFLRGSCSTGHHHALELYVQKVSNLESLLVFGMEGMGLHLGNGWRAPNFVLVHMH